MRRRSVLDELRTLVAVGALALAAGCATLSEEECLTGAWGAIGYEDGVEGRSPQTVGEHGRACANYGVRVDLDAWRLGYEEGLKVYCTFDNGFSLGAEGGTPTGACQAADPQAFAAWRSGYEEGLSYYCTPDNGFELGARGQSYGGACRGPFGEAFELAYADGRELRAARDDYEDARRRYRDIDRDLDRLVDRRAATYAEIADEDSSEDASEERRAALLAEVGRLDAEIGDLRARRRSAARDLEDEEDRLDVLNYLFSRRYAAPGVF